jgi:predicted DsbA family dithiol-disulfide isomerase
MRVEIWSDVVCPWCYIGKERFAKGLADFPHKDEVEVVFRSFELDPQHPKDLIEPVAEVLAKKYGATEAQIRRAERQFAETARAEGLDFLDKDRDRGNTFDIHRLLQFAQTKGVQDDLVSRTSKAYFAEERSVFDRERLLELAAEAGLDPREAAAVLDDPSAYAQEVRRDEREAHELGATGVPFFVLDQRYGVSGGQPPEVFRQALEEAWRTRPQTHGLASVPGFNSEEVAQTDEVCGPDGACAVPQR